MFFCIKGKLYLWFSEPFLFFKAYVNEHVYIKLIIYESLISNGGRGFLVRSKKRLVGVKLGY